MFSLVKGKTTERVVLLLCLGLGESEEQCIPKESLVLLEQHLSSSIPTHDSLWHIVVAP